MRRMAVARENREVVVLRIWQSGILVVVDRNRVIKLCSWQLTNPSLLMTSSDCIDAISVSTRMVAKLHL